MDSNGLRFWMLSRHEDWLSSLGSNTLYYCAKSNRLQLRSVSSTPPPLEDFNTASTLVEAVPMARDQFGNYARWDSVPTHQDGSIHHVVAGGSGPTNDPTAAEIPIFASVLPVSDLVMGYDGILYIAVNGTLVLVDRRGRWPDFTFSDPTFAFWRLLALPDGGVLALDRTAPQLGRVTGQPLPVRPQDPPKIGVLRSCTPPDPPRIVARYPLPSTEAYVAFTAMDSGKVALLSWGAATKDNQVANLRTFQESAGLGKAMQVSTLRWPHAVAWVGEQQVAVLATNIKEALIFDLHDATSNLVQTGDSYILSKQNVGPFVHGFDQPPRYADGTAILPLLPLSLNSFAPSGFTDAGTPQPFDSGVSQSVWHRLFMEAVVPPRCGIVVWLASSDTRADLGDDTKVTWYPHLLGAVDPSLTGYQLPAALSATLTADTPRAVLQSQPSEVPFGPSMLGESQQPGRQGLFMALVQRGGAAVRAVRGRYLGIRVLLVGDSRNTPEIAALRAYASRFSYVEHYLPEIYHEQRFGTEADQPGSSTRRDFYERFVNIFESQMTRIEDRVANAYVLTRAESVPDDSLDWLGSFIGLDPTGYPPDRRRARLLAAPELYRGTKRAPGGRGTALGITKALDVATDGLCRRGAIIVIEDFRLRHIFATILGANLSNQNDPLLPGYVVSSNSIVGDTLFLGNPLDKDFLALFASAMETPAEQQQVLSFYDELAHRMTVFVHDQVETVDLRLVQTIVDQEKPAHVKVSIRRAARPLMIGLASLLGVNTYLTPEPPRGTATVQRSRIGRYDVITHVPSLDPRLESGISSAEWNAPIARVQAPPSVSVGEDIPLNGSFSTAPSGTNLIAFNWKLVGISPALSIVPIARVQVPPSVSAQSNVPIARVQAPPSVSAGDDIPLDGSSSTAPSGANLIAFTWKLVSS